MSRPARREAVRCLVARGVSQRRACWRVGLGRSTYQYHARPARAARDTTTLERMRQLAAHHPRYGYRRIWALLRQAGAAVNRKRIYRLWHQAQLQVARPARRQRRPAAAPAEPPTQASAPGQVWTYDFVQDACLNGSKLRLLTVVDEFTRECLAIHVATSLPAVRVIRVLAGLVAAQGAPAFLRSDNGPEFVALVLRAWLASQHTTTLYIDPGCPWQNGREERFNGTLRDECLNRQAFLSVAEAQAVVEAYRREYNEVRPHSRLGYRSPAAFKRDWLASHPPTSEV